MADTTFRGAICGAFLALLLSLVSAAPAAAGFSYVEKWGTGTAGSADGQFNQPRSVATDSAGNVYVADLGNSRIQKFSATGTFITKWGTQGAADGQFAQGSPAGLAVDAAGNVYAADRNNHRIQKFTSDGVHLMSFGNFGQGPGQLNAPEGVAVDSGGNIYVAEYSGQRVQKFSPAGVFLQQIGGGRGSAGGQFEFPSDAAVDGSDNLYVADRENNRVQKFSPDGTFSNTWGSFGSGDGQFMAVPGLFAGAAGGVYAADFNNRRIQKFTTDGAFLDTFGDIAVFNRPVDVAERDGNVYVVDQFAQAVHRLREDAGLDAPTLGETANARAVRGTVLVGIPAKGARAAQKGVRFVPLEQAREIPIGSFLDTRRGTVSLTTARNRAGKIQSGRFSGGLFQVLQSRARKAKGLTELQMKGSAAGFSSCRANARRASAALSRRTIRRLRANARGRYRSRGRHSAATVRGTKWVMEDRCDGTLTTVKRGKVAVRDFRLKKTIVVTAGKSYLATARDGG